MGESVTQWACVRKEFSDLTIHNIMQSWRACLKTGVAKKKDLVP